MDATPQATSASSICLSCGYSLAGLPPDANCPLCGRQAPGSPALPTTTPATATCIRCAYSLRGLPPSGICPECGTPIERSLRGDLLVYSDPEYIRRLLAGARLVFWSLLALIVLMVTAILFLFGNAWPLAQFAGLAMLVSLLAFVAGWWLITWPDIAQLSSNKGQRPRRIVRYSLIAIIAIVGAVVAAPYFPFRISSDIRIMVFLLVYPAMGLGFCAGMLYLRWLAPRIPDARIYDRAKILLILLGCIVGTVILGIMFTAGSNSGGPACATGLLFFGAFIASIVAVVMYCRVFFLLRNSLRLIAKSQAAPGPDSSASL